MPTFGDTVRHSGDTKTGGGGDLLKTWRCVVSYSDYSAAATTEALDLTTLTSFPANALVSHAHAELLEVFAGGSVSAATVQLGDTADPNELITASDVFTGATLGNVWAPGVYTAGTLEATYVPELLLTTTTDNVDALTSGKIEVVVHYYKPDSIYS